MKLCVIYNFAAHYREAVFELMDRTFDCDWFFGESNSDIKKMDYSVLNGKVTETRTKYLFGGWTWQPKLVSQLFKDYDTYILLGETRALSTWAFCILARILKPRKRVFFWSHGWYGKESRLEAFVKRILFRLPNGGTFVYGDYAIDLMIREGLSPEKLYPIHNSLSYDRQISIRGELTPKPIYTDHFGNSNPNLFFVGRLTSVKRLDLILDAMVVSQNKGHKYNLTLIGGGIEQENLKMKVGQLGLDSQVWFYGPCYDEKELSSLIYNADLCVAPGNIGLTAMHSMVFGTPCITHNDFSHQMPEFEAINPGRTGAFFKYNDVDDLSRSIDKWFCDHGLEREQVRASCMEVIDEDWNPYYQLEILKKVLSV